MSLRCLLAASLFLFPTALPVAAQLDAEMDAPTAMPIDDTSAALRGYGKIHLTESQEKGCTIWKFEPIDQANTKTAVAKFLADLNLSPGVTTGTIDASPTIHLPTTTVPGGAVYTGFLLGDTGTVDYWEEAW